MRDENVRVREKFELSLDGRQIASIVVGALVILGVVFVLGLNVGRQIAARQVEAARGGDLEALDRVPVAAAQPGKNDLTFYDQLPKGKPAPPLPEPARPAAPAPTAAVAPAAQPARTPPPSTPGAPAQGAAPAATETSAPAPVAPAPAAAALAAVVTTPPAAPEPARSPSASAKAATPKPAAASGAFVIQLAATQSRAEAERIAARHRALSPRIEAADVPGKGRFYRVRAGSFATRPEAERALAQAARQSGAKGFVTAAGAH